MLNLILEEEKWLGMPKNIFFLLMMVLLALFCFSLNRWRFSRFSNISPTKIRKANAGDGHRCSCTLEVEVDNWLYAQKIFHTKPHKAEKGEFFENSDGIPNFVVYYPESNHEKIHSIIILKGVPRDKNVPPIIFIPNLKPKYPMFILTDKELLDPDWQQKIYGFYKILRNRVKAWAKKEGMRLIDLREKYDEKDSK